MKNDSIAPADILNGTVGIVAAYLGRNQMAHAEVPAFMRLVAAELAGGVAQVANGSPSLTADEGVSTALGKTASPLAISAPPAPEAAPAEPAAEAQAETPSAQEGVSGDAAPPVAEKPYKFAHLSRVPVIPIGDSVRNDEVICLFDNVGKKMLKRHIRARYGMEEDEYREHFGLPKEYPMRAPGYAAEKSLVAKAQGLGTDKISKAPRGERAANVTTLSAAA